jgi:hypothetical protein
MATTSNSTHERFGRVEVELRISRFLGFRQGAGFHGAEPLLYGGTGVSCLRGILKLTEKLANEVRLTFVNLGLTN